MVSKEKPRVLCQDQRDFIPGISIPFRDLLLSHALIKVSADKSLRIKELDVRIDLEF